MSEPTASSSRDAATPRNDGVEPRSAAPTTAGAVLRSARQAQGLHIAALAASIKVTQRKLESLEADRYDELPDLTFTRALAKTVCRSLKIDATPVLALLPQLSETGLDGVHQGLNTTFRDRPGRVEPTDLSVLTRPTFWVPLLLVLAAGAIYLLPQRWLADVRPPAPVASAAAPSGAASAAANAASTAALPASLSASEAPAAATVTDAAPAFPPGPLAEPAAGAEMTGVLQLRVTGESWVEVLDAHGASLLQRMLQPGEAVGLDGTPPFKLKIGNAAVTQLSFRGRPVELAPSTRDNVARLELK
jgi:cytoskeleton protein RodZ